MAATCCQIILSPKRQCGCLMQSKFECESRTPHSDEHLDGHKTENVFRAISCVRQNCASCKRSCKLSQEVSSVKPALRSCHITRDNKTPFAACFRRLTKENFIKSDNRLKLLKQRNFPQEGEMKQRVSDKRECC